MVLMHGELYQHIPTPTGEPAGVSLTISRTRLDLHITLPGPTQREKDAIGQERPTFASAYHQDIIFLLVAFGRGGPWLKAAYSQWLVPEEDRVSLQDLEAYGEQHIVRISLIDARTGGIETVRTSMLSPRLSWRLRDQYWCQSRSPQVDPREFRRRVAAVEELYPTPVLAALAMERRS